MEHSMGTTSFDPSKPRIASYDMRTKQIGWQGQGMSSLNFIP